MPWRFWSMKPSDFIGRATRTASGIAIPSFLGLYFLNFYESQNKYELARNLSQTMNWAAFTCVLVTSPVTGKAAKTGLQRLLGTVVGGLLGFFVFQGADHLGLQRSVPFMTTIAALMGFLGCYVGWIFELDISAKLFSLTYLLVVFGAQSDGDARTLAETRSGGICMGVLLSLALSVFVFPQSATAKAIEQLKEALKCLSDLNALAWCHAELARDPGAMQKALRRSATTLDLDTQPDLSVITGTIGKGHLHQPLLDKSKEARQAAGEEEQVERIAEHCLDKVYTRLEICEKQLKLAKNEVGMSKLFGMWCFLPACAWCWCGGWRLPKKELQKVLISVRRVARLLWSLHITFANGFDENMGEILAQDYPQQLFPQLVAFSETLVQELYDAFPTCSNMSTMALDSFSVAVEGLIRFSDYQRRRKNKTIKRFKRAASCRQLQAGGTSCHTDSPDSIRWHSAWRSAGNLLERPRPVHLEDLHGLHSDSDAESSIDHTPHFHPNGNPAVHGLLEGIAHEAVRQAHVERDGSAAATHGVSHEVAALAAQLAQHPDLAHVVVQLAEQLQHNGHDHGNGSMPVAINGTPRGGTPRGGSEYAGSPGSGSDLGHSPTEVLANLPPGLVISTTQSFKAAHRSFVPAAEPAPGKPLVRCELREHDSMHLEMFPDSHEGHMAKVRWYSFQFLMEELRDEFRILHKALGALISKMPHAQQHENDKHHNEEHSSEAASNAGAHV